MEGSSSNNSSGFDSKIIWVIVWLFSLAIVAIVSYGVGKGSLATAIRPTPAPTTSLREIPTAPPPSPTQVAAPEPTIDLEAICDKTGPSQKKDYLVTYYMKEGDNISLIAERELGDSKRTSEIITLNEGGPALAVGSALYLPPNNIKQSSGHIAEVSGKIVKKDNASWQLTYGGGTSGPGVVFPGFWFKNITEADNYKIGDCVTILFDNGVKVYSIRKS